MVRFVTDMKFYTINFQKRPQVGGKEAIRKEDRIRNTLLPYYETRMVYHDPSLAKLEYQLEYLGKSTHDDCADSNECAFYMLDFPSSLDISFFESPNSSKADTSNLPWEMKNRKPDSNFFRENWRTL